MNDITLKIRDVAKALGKSEQFVRVMIQRGKMPFADGTQLRNGGRWNYIIYKERFEQYLKGSL